MDNICDIPQYNDVDSKKRICAGIVLYNPDISRLKSVIAAVALQVQDILLVDNGSSNYHDIEMLIANCDKTTVILLGENKGIAAALNVICEAAVRQGFHEVLTLDQDTVIECDMVKKLESQMDDHVGIVCPRVSYEGNEEFQPIPREAVEEVDWAITSGSLTSLEAWKEVGGFDEQMFIDGVDRDFCLRLWRKGWGVKRVNDAVIHHQLGKLHCKRVLGKTIYATNHPAWRRYYMARNHIYLCRKGLVRSEETIGWLAKETVKVLLFEAGGVPKVLKIVRGVWDGLRMEVATR